MTTPLWPQANGELKDRTAVFENATYRTARRAESEIGSRPISDDAS